MKKIILFFILLITTAWIQAQVTSLTGSGTAVDPWKIGTIDELKFLRDQINQSTDGLNLSDYQTAGMYFELTANIDLTGENWVPIGAMQQDYASFRGYFNGAGFKISNLTIGAATTRYASDLVGLFGELRSGAVIRNLNIENAAIYSTTTTTVTNNGILAARAFGNVLVENVKILNSTLDVLVNDIGINAGGVVGVLRDAVVINSLTINVNITTESKNNLNAKEQCVGGIAGRVLAATSAPGSRIINCSTNGSSVLSKAVDTTPSYFAVGGILGRSAPNTNVNFNYVINCYTNAGIELIYSTTTPISGVKNVGGIVGTADANFQVANSIAENTSITQSNAGLANRGRVAGTLTSGASASTNYASAIPFTPAFSYTTGINNKNGADIGSNNPFSTLNVYVTANPTFSFPTTVYGGTEIAVSLIRWVKELDTNTNISALNNCENCDVKVNGGTLSLDEEKTIKNLSVDAGAKIDATNSLTITGNLVLKASKVASPIVKLSAGMVLSGNLSFEKTFDNTKWYWVSFPSDVAVNEIAKVSGSETLTLGTNWWIKYYDGATRAVNLGTVSNWKNVIAGETLTANKGYIIGLSNSLIGDYVLSFPLNKSLVQSAETARTVDVVPHGEGSVAANHVGWNLVGVPYLSNFEGAGVGANYLTFYNGISYVQSEKENVSNINPFESFFVQASTAGTTANLSFDLSNRQLVKGVANDSHLKIPIQLTTATGTDITTLLVSDNYSNDYVINQDLEKWLTIGTDVPQLYSRLNNTRFAFNALPAESVLGLQLGVYTKEAGEATISLKSIPTSEYSVALLADNTTGISTNLLTNNYTFNSIAGTEDDRFSITFQKVTSQQMYATDSNVNVVVVSGGMLLSNLPSNNSVRVFDFSGKMLFSSKSANDQLFVPLITKGYCTIQIVSTHSTQVVKVSL